MGADQNRGAEYDPKNVGYSVAMWWFAATKEEAQGCIRGQSEGSNSGEESEATCCSQRWTVPPNGSRRACRITAKVAAQLHRSYRCPDRECFDRLALQRLRRSARGQVQMRRSRPASRHAIPSDACPTKPTPRRHSRRTTCRGQVRRKESHGVYTGHVRKSGRSDH